MKNRAEELIAGILKDLPPGETAREFAKFVTLLFDRADADDLASYEPETLLAIARSLWDLTEFRVSGQKIIRVFNPELSREGYNGQHTVVQIATNDMPFIIDSVLGELTALGYTTARMLHPIVEMRRDPFGQRLQVEGAGSVLHGTTGDSAPEAGNVNGDGGASENGFIRESILHVEIPREQDPRAHRAIERNVEAVLRDVALVVEDWPQMLERTEEAIHDLRVRAPFQSGALEPGEFEETLAFLKWLMNGNFAFLGIRDYEIEGGVDEGTLIPRQDTGLGILSDPDARVLRRQGELVLMTPEVREFLLQPAPIIVSKANVRSRVHRRVFMDYIGIKRYSLDGQVIGERRIVGLFTAVAYNRSTWDVPLLARKVALVMEKANLPSNGHDERSLVNILETFPRDELFQASLDEILEVATGVLRLQKRPRTRIFVRHDRFDRFVAVQVFVIRDRYDTTVRKRISDLLETAYDGTVQAYYPTFGDGPLARLYLIVSRNIGPLPDVNERELEYMIEGFTRSWADDLRTTLLDHFGPMQGRDLTERYIGGFSPGYRDRFTCTEAVRDIEIMESMQAPPSIGLRTYRYADDKGSMLRLKLYHWDRPIPLSDSLPVFENMGLRVLDEVPYGITFPRNAGLSWADQAVGGRTVYIHSFTMEHGAAQDIDLERVREPLEDTFRAIWSGLAEDDRFNRLVVEQAMSWGDVTILRTFARFRRQIGQGFSARYVVNTLGANGGISLKLVDLFRTKFDPDLATDDRGRADLVRTVTEDISNRLDDVASLDADRILRSFLNLIESAQRTNFFQTDETGARKPYVSIKFSSRMITDLPAPKPLYEIYVYSPRVEGVHLRGGPVARGGIRWSDRPEDFRFEILGLQKAQTVKNALIVPEGAKGGFVPKRLTAAGGAKGVNAREEAIACYQLFIQGLLDLTDNLVDNEPVRPQRVVAYDGDDPYLVVAADKGTATFSDIANAMSESQGFWLSDAFASGGRTGYDHKKMGITARGAWEAVKRHFREMDIDIQSTPFTVAGVGDMSGDVFGNGMLLSRQIRLVAAFDHRDIFIDPNPDPAASYAERERLFRTPGVTWQNYDRALLSEGGGIFPRSEKFIRLTPQIQDALDIPQARVTPLELIRAILAAPVDLLWFGGIGTYIKASSETQADAADRANDAVRINAKDLRARVIGEGANLGLTQRGRIEYARRGGRLNTDSVDNSAGVDSSDHEVNIKIALSAAVNAGRMDMDQRNAFLELMTDEVARLVLKNNYNQTLTLSIAEAAALEDFDAHARLMRELEHQGALDRVVEFLPDDETMAELKENGLGLTRPELSVLLAYSKITLYKALVASDVPEDPYLERYLVEYFPQPMGEHVRDALLGHRLRREIIATQTVNRVVNMGGSTFINRIQENMGLPQDQIVRATLSAQEVFRLGDLTAQINALDLQVPAEVQIAAHRTVVDFLRRQVLWFLRYRPADLRIDEAIGRYYDAVAELSESLPSMLMPFEAEQMVNGAEVAREAGLDPALAGRLAMLSPLGSATDIIDVANAFGWTPKATGAAYFSIGAALDLDRLRFNASTLSSDEHWDRLAIKRTVEDLFRQQRFLTLTAIGEAVEGGVAESDGEAASALWRERNAVEICRVRTLIDDMTSAGPLSAGKLSLAGSQIRDLIASVSGRRGVGTPGTMPV